MDSPEEDASNAVCFDARDAVCMLTKKILQIFLIICVRWLICMKSISFGDRTCRIRRMI